MMSGMNDKPDDAKYGANVYPDGILGVFTSVSIVFLVWGYCWLKNYGTFHFPQRINVVFHQVAGLNTNASVYVDGVRIGIVDALEWQDTNRVLVKLRINSSRVVVPKGSKFTILTNGIVGAKFVEITFPQVAEGMPRPEPLDESSEVIGEDPVRPELAVNKLAIGLSKIDMQEFHENFESDRKRLARAADQLSDLAKKTMPVVEKALPLEEEIIALSKDVRFSLEKINKLLAKTNFSDDVKEVSKQAKETVSMIQSIVTEVNTTIKDKNIRKDLLDSIQRLSDASKSVEKSVNQIEEMSKNKELREDVKTILKDARSALNKADQLLNNKDFTKDIGVTIRKTNETLKDVDSAAKRLNQILDKRFPLPRLIFGRPGHLNDKK